MLSRMHDPLLPQRHLGIEHSCPLEIAPSWRPLPDELVKEALEIMLDVDKNPVLALCS